MADSPTTTTHPAPHATIHALLDRIVVKVLESPATTAGGSLLRHLNAEANRGKGLSSFVLTNLDGNSEHFGKHRFAGVVYRDTASDNGVLINFCPWCGVSLQPYLEKVKNWNN